MNKREPKNHPIVSEITDSGEIVEMVYDGRNSSLCIHSEQGWNIVPGFELNGRQVVPYSPFNNLVKHRVVLFPECPSQVESVGSLVDAVRDFIRGLVALTPAFEEVAVHYVLLSWVHDRFPALPYLRVKGDPGSGKTRFLTVVGSLCYKPIFASGASTVSPLFRIMDTFRGTLILDESDFRTSDEQTEIVKILNNGHAKGFPVLRTESNHQREFNPHAYAVFGPKLIATRGLFQDSALESRCLTEEMGQGSLRREIPTALPADFHSRALALRNQLLSYRLKHFKELEPVSSDLTVGLEPRLRQIVEPLLAVANNEESKVQIVAFAMNQQAQTILDRGMEVEARVLEVIRDLLLEPFPARLSIKEITDRFLLRFGDEYDRRVNTKWIGGIIRSGLHLRTMKSGGVFVIPPDEIPKLGRLYERYGIEPHVVDETSGRPRSP